jgi:hypothetical protein
MKIPALSGKTPFILAALLLIIALVPSYIFYTQYRTAQKKLTDPNFAVSEEIKNVISRVSQLIVLPENETPTIATISNTDKLKDRPFFANAKNGDKLIIYPNAKKAILYDPVVNKVIDIGPVSLPSVSPETGTGTSSAVISPSASNKLKGYIYNGTNVTGLTLTFEKKYKDKLPNLEFVDRDNAQKKDFEKTLVIDLTGAKKTQAEEIAKTIGAEISSLPAGEVKPENVDILIIVGRDKSK